MGIGYGVWGVLLDTWRTRERILSLIKLKKHHKQTSSLPSSSCDIRLKNCDSNTLLLGEIITWPPRWPGLGGC